jgi:hypothetical protein
LFPAIFCIFNFLSWCGLDKCASFIDYSGPKIIPLPFEKNRIPTYFVDCKNSLVKTRFLVINNYMLSVIFQGQPVVLKTKVISNVQTEVKIRGDYIFSKVVNQRMVKIIKGWCGIK